MTEASRLDANVDDGVLVEGSPFREILVRASQMKKACERLLETAVPTSDGSSYVVSEETLEALREVVRRWSEPLD
jgi:hypothetical protein